MLYRQFCLLFQKKFIGIKDDGFLSIFKKILFGILLNYLKKNKSNNFEVVDFEKINKN